MLRSFRSSNGRPSRPRRLIRTNAGPGESSLTARASAADQRDGERRGRREDEHVDRRAAAAGRAPRVSTRTAGSLAAADGLGSRRAARLAHAGAGVARPGPLARARHLFQHGERLPVLGEGRYAEQQSGRLGGQRSPEHRGGDPDIGPRQHDHDAAARQPDDRVGHAQVGEQVAHDAGEATRRRARLGEGDAGATESGDSSRRTRAKSRAIGSVGALRRPSGSRYAGDPVRERCEPVDEDHQSGRRGPRTRRGPRRRSAPRRGRRAQPGGPGRPRRGSRAARPASTTPWAARIAAKPSSQGPSAADSATDASGGQEAAGHPHHQQHSALGLPLIAEKHHLLGRIRPNFA